MIENNDDQAKPLYRVGPGKPPLETRFKKGISGNPRGRPPRLKRLILPVQHIMDLIKVMDAPVTYRRGNELITRTGFVAAIEVLKLKALAGHAPSLRHFIKLSREAFEEVQKREPRLAAEVDQYRQHLNTGDPPFMVTGAVNARADELNQLYKDPTRERPKRRKSRRKLLIKMTPEDDTENS